MRIAVRSDGFSLIEVLIACAVLIGGVVSLAQLFATATRSNTDARDAARAAVLAAQKLEQLRAVPWGDAALIPSPPGSIEQSAEGYVDYLDRLGIAIGGGSSPPDGAAFTRRWAVVPAGLPGALVLEVVVTRGSRTTQEDNSASPFEARLAMLRTGAAP